MKLKKFTFTLFLIFVLNILSQENKIEIENNNIENIQAQEAPIEILIGILPSIEEDYFEAFSTNIKKCLEGTFQVKTTLKKLNQPKDKKAIKSLFNKGFDWVVFVGASKDKKQVEVRIYDPIEALMIVGKKFNLNKSKKFLSYKISDFIWNELLGEPNCFCSRIAFIKRKKNIIGKNYSEIWSADFDGSNQRKIISDSNIYVGLSWYNNPNTPCLLGSELTKFNTKLICFNSKKLKRTLLNAAGTCIGISLCPKKKQAIYCRSGDIWHYEHDLKTKRFIHKKIISNDGKNTTPTLLKSGDIIFCSNSKSLFTKDAINKKNKLNSGPKIYYYNNKNKEIELITTEGYCESPSYSEANNQIAYSKRVNKEMQLFIYDINTKKHKQITFNSGSKIDCRWSPCGQYIVFCHKTNTKSSISIININLNKQWSITLNNEECVYPAWSSNFIKDVF